MKKRCRSVELLHLTIQVDTRLLKEHSMRLLLSFSFTTFPEAESTLKRQMNYEPCPIGVSRVNKYISRQAFDGQTAEI